MPGPTGRPPDSNGRRLAGSPLYLDMTLWSVVLFDRGGMFEAYLAGLRERMRALGSRRVPFKGGAFWDYKPDFQPGDVVEP